METEEGKESAIDELNDNVDIIIEYLKMIVEKLDRILKIQW